MFQLLSSKAKVNKDSKLKDDNQKLDNFKIITEQDSKYYKAATLRIKRTVWKLK